MSVEKAYSLSKEADCWLNVGWCHTREDLLGVNPIFKDMLRNIERNAQELGYGSYPVVWNDNKRVNPKGGNDIWQSGVARPDLVLRDLATILHHDDQGEADKTIYYRQIN
jgi:iron complex transport system substrate-binding protein